MLMILGILTVLLIVAGCWFVGFWNNLITLFCTIIAALTATSFFEIVATKLEGTGSSYTYMLDFTAIWLVFVGTFSVLRIGTEYLSKYQVKFNFVLEMVGRSIVSLLIGIVFVTFASFTMHFAPIPSEAFNDKFTYQIDEDTRYLGLLDYGWSNFVRFESNNALSEYANPPWHDEIFMYVDENGNEVWYSGPAADEAEEADRGERIWYRRPFDPYAAIPTRYADRRKVFARVITAQEELDGNNTLRVGREDPE